MLSTQELRIYTIHQEGFPEEAVTVAESNPVDAAKLWCPKAAVFPWDPAFTPCVATVTHGAHKWRVLVDREPAKLTFEVLT